ncbi:MAG: DNA gyrase modulator, partial [Candidatus Thermoplasmatota archaeon]
MVGSKQRFEEVAEKIMDESTADEVEVRIVKSDTALTRYANSRIHQNIGQKDTQLSIRAVFGKRVGSATTNSLEDDFVENCLSKAEKIAENQREDPDFKDLPGLKKDIDKESYYVKETADYSPDKRAEKVKEIIEMAKSEGVDRVYGAFQTDSKNLFVANSHGVKRSSKLTSANLTTNAIVDWDN